MLRTAVARHLTERFGKGPWSSTGPERVTIQTRHSRLFVVRQDEIVVAALRLGTKRPWAIDVSHFTPASRPIYLTDMAVLPELQGRGLGEHCLEDARQIAKGWPGDVIRLDAWDAPAGAGGFYRKCGFQERGRVRYRNSPLIYFELVV